jgi:integrase
VRLFQSKGCKSWRVRFSINGREFDVPLKTRLKEVAGEKALKLVREKEMEMAGLLLPKMLVEVAQTPLLDLLDEWVRIGLPPDVTRKHRAYSRNRPARVFEACGWRFIRDVTPESFETWRVSQRKAGVQPKTLNEYLAHIRTFLKWMEGRNKIGLNPLQVVKPLKVVRDESQRAFTLDELERLLAVVPEYRACLYIIAAFTGLRRRELKALEWKSVILSPEGSALRLEAAKTKNRNGGLLPLHPDAEQSLACLRAAAPKEARRVFFNGVTQMKRFKKDLELAGIAEKDAYGRTLNLHSFRRSLATFLNRTGVPIRVAMAILRHSDMKLTMNVYTDEAQLPMREELNKLGGIKSSPKSSLFSSRTVGNDCPTVSTSEDVAAVAPSTEVPQGEEIRPDLAGVVQGCPTLNITDRGGIRTPGS